MKVNALVLASTAALLLTASCGEVVYAPAQTGTGSTTTSSTSAAGTGGAATTSATSATGTGGAAGAPSCPPAAPADASKPMVSCDNEGLVCAYPLSPCPLSLKCTGTGWQGLVWTPQPPQAGAACEPAPLPCVYDATMEDCCYDIHTAACGADGHWMVAAGDGECPLPAPAPGDACQDAQAHQCSYAINGATVTLLCTMGAWAQP